MSKQPKKLEINRKSHEDDANSTEATSSQREHDYAMDVELTASGEKRSLDEMSDSPPLTPSKGAHTRKISKQNPSATDVMEAILALHSRFDTQEIKMAEINTKMTQNAVMIANITRSIEFNAEEVKECKEKVAVLETKVSVLRKEVDELTERSREQDRYKRRWNLRIKGMREKMEENIRQDVIRLLGDIAPEWSRNMDDYVDTVHRLGRMEENRTRQVIVQFTKRQHRDGIWRMTKKSQVCEAAKIRFTEDLTREDKLEREKLWPQILQARKAELQKIAADMFQMEAALFVPTGTMSNLIAVMVHCRERGDEMIVGDLSHLHIYEQGGSAQLAGVHATTVDTLPDGTFDLEQLESKIRHGYPDPHYPRSRLICVENTQNIQGGRVLPLNFLQEVLALADRYGLSVHMDGARLMNAAVALGVPPSTILQHTHTVSVCLSKGLGAPVGTILAGPQDFISRAVRCRKALGGGMRQAGIIAAAGKMSLLQMVGRLEEDHRNAKTFAQALLSCDPTLFAVDMAAVETNILRFRLQEPSLGPSEFCARMGQVGEGEEAALGQGIIVKMYPHYANSVRAVWHLGISPEDTQLAIQKMQFVASQFLKEKTRAQ